MIKRQRLFIFAKGKAIETAWAVNVQLQKEKYILEKDMYSLQK